MKQPRWLVTAITVTLLAANTVAEELQGHVESHAQASPLSGPNLRRGYHKSLSREISRPRAQAVAATPVLLQSQATRDDVNKAVSLDFAVQDFCTFGFGLVVVFLIATMIYEYWSRKEGEAAALRDGRWDMVKFWCMFFVLWSHTMGYWQPPGKGSIWYGFPQEFTSHFHMPGFSFVSGLFSAGLATKEGGKFSVSFKKVKSSLRDLIFVKITMVPFSALAPLMWAGNPDWSLLLSTPLIEFPTLWYLDALFVWHALTPLICMTRRPVILAAAVSILFRTKETSILGMFSYFVFYVLGFVMGGGGKSSQEQSDARKYLEKCLTDKKARIAAFFLLSLWAAFRNISMPEPLMIVFSEHIDFYRGTTPWSLGGWFTDAARIGFHVLLLFAFFAMMFLMPSCELLSSTGSRTLYVYVLHNQLMIWNYSLTDVKHIVTSSQQWKPLTAAVISFVFMLLLGSRLMKALTHHFVQPQWLVDLCLPESMDDSSIQKKSGQALHAS